MPMTAEHLEMCYHEAGHAVVALALDREVPFVWCSQTKGCTQVKLLPDCPTSSDIRKQLAIDVAGWAASALADTKGRPVLPRLQRFVDQKIHFVSRKLRTCGELAGQPLSVLEHYSDEAQAWATACRLPGSSAERLAEVERAESWAYEMLRRHRHSVDALSTALSRKGDESLSAAEVRNTVAAAGSILPLPTDDPLLAKLTATPSG
jgi:hypothetical protein